MNKLNLLPWRKYYQQRQQKIFFFSIASSILIAVIMIALINAVAKFQINQCAKQNKGISNKIVEINAEIKKNDLQQAQARKILKEEADMKDISQQQQWLVDLFNTLPQIIPTNLYLKTINLDANKVILIGVASSHADVTLLIDRLEKLTWLEAVKLISIDEAGFKIEVVMKKM